jgi:diketogulonate reductase-like aldo/keto reductase
MVYGSLTSLYKDPERNAALNKALEEVAAKHSTSPAAVLQAWTYARTDGIVVTTTSKETRAREYVADAAKLAQLSEQDLGAIEEASRQGPPLKYYMTDVFDPSK